MWDDNFLYRKPLRKVSKETRQAHQTNIRFYMTANATQGEMRKKGAVNMTIENLALNTIYFKGLLSLLF